MKEEIEFEKKFLIRDENTFLDIKGKLRHPNFQDILGYHFEQYFYKERVYRCFDTFEGDLAKEKTVLECIGELEKRKVSMSAREREKDYILTIKLPTQNREERQVYENLIGPENDFYSLNPEDFSEWKPFEMIKEITRGRSLQEVVRLYVKTSRLLFTSAQGGLEISVDEVVGKFPFPFNCQTIFYELEIEKEGESPQEDIEIVSGYFIAQYPHSLVESPEPKWVKALRFLRGEGL
ncbi:MAG: hypothetical protein ABIA37_02310 [Candidatus Woesearchaeota archaeon]